MGLIVRASLCGAKGQQHHAGRGSRDLATAQTQTPQSNRICNGICNGNSNGISPPFGVKTLRHAALRSNISFKSVRANE